MRPATLRRSCESAYPQISIDIATGVIRGIGGGHAYEELQAWHSNMCLAVPSSSTVDGTWVKQETCGTSADANQHWQLLRLGNGYYRLVVRHSHKCLTAPMSPGDNGVVRQRPCSTAANQQWQFTALDGGYQVPARNSGKCLTIPYASTVDGAPAIQFPCRRAINQQWRLTGAPY
ncbi:hypothetical protein ABIE67_009211 [Streptomyces sp. V4I8]|uniref:RICIN domain-containing protein n=1 Tax=Streptomyces sp. V4I8 TaxID=3156469 RepID=UPI00351907DE